MDEVRQERVDAAISQTKEESSFDYERHVKPAKGWYAISQQTGLPVEIRI